MMMQSFSTISLKTKSTNKVEQRGGEESARDGWRIDRVISALETNQRMANQVFIDNNDLQDVLPEKTLNSYQRVDLLTDR